jgi:hypothetical protein
MGNGVARRVTLALGQLLGKAWLANAPNTDKESGRQKPCHGLLSAAPEASSSLEPRAAGMTPEIPLICKRAMLADLLSKQPPVLDGMDDSNVRLEKSS